MRLSFFLSPGAIAERDLNALDTRVVDDHLWPSGLALAGAQAGGFLGREALLAAHSQSGVDRVGASTVGPGLGAGVGVGLGDGDGAGEAEGFAVVEADGATAGDVAVPFNSAAVGGGPPATRAK